MKQTFKQFMKQFRKQSNRFGDLAGDMAVDREFTKKNTKEGILDYLDSVGACDNAIEVFNDAWDMYEDSRITNEIKSLKNEPKKKQQEFITKILREEMRV